LFTNKGCRSFALLLTNDLRRTLGCGLLLCNTSGFLTRRFLPCGLLCSSGLLLRCTTRRFLSCSSLGRG